MGGLSGVREWGRVGGCSLLLEVQVIPWARVVDACGVAVTSGI